VGHTRVTLDTIVAAFERGATAEEIAQAEEARISCPTETIGNDGE
jgi:hypothetical protein